MIRNVVIHVMNEQPLLADIYSLPTAADAGLVCTNLRSMDGKRPIFIDRSESVFFFPYLVIRFLEIPPDEMARHMAEGGAMPAASASPAGQGTSGVTAPGPEARLPVPVPDDEPEIDALLPEPELEIDEDFLRRIRDI